MEVLVGVAGKIAELTVIPIGRQVGYLLFYKENFKELKDKSVELETRKVHIEHDVERERRNGREIEADVVSWQKRVDETLEEAKKLYGDQTHDIARCWKCSFPNLKSRHQLGRKAKKMAFVIAELKENGRFDRIGYVPISGIENIIFASPSNGKLESRNLVKKEVMLSLNDPEVCKVGMYGWGGVGKTTLAKEVAKHVKDDKLFDVVVMATISQTFDVERVRNEIAYQLGFHLDEMTSVGKANQLCARIKMENHILIILDDLWEKIDLDKLGIPSEQHPKGCKLLLTSRSLGTLQNNDTQRNFALEALNIVESWSLFEDMVGDAIKDANLQKIATQVVERCVGLPVMIVSIAKSLKYNKNIYYWKDALNNLKRVDNGDVYGTVFSAFEFTYERLKNDEMKKVFLLCGVEGPSILVSDLLKYVIGLGIMKHTDTIEDARNRLYRIIEDLKASCFLLEDDASETNGIKMHDLVSEIAISIAQKKEHVCLLKNVRIRDWPRLERCTQLILESCYLQELPQKLDCPNLKFFHLTTDNCILEIPDSFFEGMESLEVIDLTGLKISSLPRSLVSLTKLRTLCLDQCILEDMIGIGSLINLEILSFIHSSIKELPSEIGQLTHLRMLDLSYSGIEMIPPNTLSRLTNIEELYMGNASIKWEEESLTKKNKCASLAELGRLTSLTTLEIQIREAWMLPRDMKFENLERYKVVIGDKWEWSDKERTSRLLKLKLDTNIHLEHGIKALVKQGEDLYLDEVNGISDVLFDLNGEGFPLLKNLHVQNNGQVQHIINTMERRNETHVLFPGLEVLTLHNLNNLMNICHGPFPVNSFRYLTVIKVKSCDQLVYLFSVSMVKALSQLVEVEVEECNSMKRIVLIENEDSSISTDKKIEFHSLHSLSLCDLPLFHDFYSNEFTSLTSNIPTPLFDVTKVGFCSLETLKLSSINMEKIWDDDHLFASNLANLIVEDCRGLKHLFSSSLIASLLKLKHIEISKCENMEEIIATEDINNTASQDKVRFLNLEKMVIKDMKSLKKLWYFQFEGIKSLEVRNCEKLVNIFPSDTQGMFGSLETLKVKDCGSMEEIFELTTGDIQIEEEATTKISQLKKLHLLDLPKLKQIWSKDPQGIVHFHHLQDVHVKHCQNIEYLFPLSVAVKLPRLEKVKLTTCGRLSEIVANKRGTMENKVVFHFDQLQTLVLWNMSKLDRFYNGNHSLTCPSLSELWSQDCDKLKLLGRHCTSEQRKNSYGQTQIYMQQPFFITEEVIPNLKEWALNNKEAMMIFQDPQWKDQYLGKLNILRFYKFEYKAAATFMDSIVQKAPNLKSLVVQDSSLKEIFRDKRVASEEGKNETKTQLQRLTLSRVQLLHICREGCQVDRILKVLEVLYVTQCDSLKNLVPSSVTFSHLIYLKIEKCNGLINLIHSSTAASLVKLQSMALKECNSLQEIVTQEMNETRDEIVFLSLITLELESLPRLNSFSSNKCFFKFPLLEKVVVRQCPRMKFFCETETSAPMLKKVIKDGKDGEWCWEGDLNGTINKIFLDKAAFSNSKHLDLSIYPELKDSWYSPIENEMFRNLKSLVVKDCDFISNVLISSNMLRSLTNLEEVDVRNCDSLQAVFEFDSTQEEAIHLRKISLSNLPKLQCIWKQECQEIASFGDSLSSHVETQSHQTLLLVEKILFPNLQVVWVEDCENLEYLFPSSIAMHAIQLEHITIKNARRMQQIVSDKEGLMDSPIKFKFNHLISLVLWDLHELVGFFAGHHSLLCPLLKKLDIRDCAKLKLFKTQYWSSQGRVFDSKYQASMQQPLFTLEEKLIGNLEELTLDSENSNMILQGQLSVENFSKLKSLCLRNFEDDQPNFPAWFLQNITSFEDIVVECCSFKEIFKQEKPTYEKRKFEIRTRIAMLVLNNLNELQHICKEGFPIDPILETLETLWVQYCSNLKNLVPSSVTFSHLTYLEVRNCNGLIHMITSSTARSLVNLTSMTIKNCNSLEHVVAEEREGSEDEITFNSLEILELECLPMMKRFCSSKCVLNFPSLVKVIVEECPRMSIFSVRDSSTPMLQDIILKEDDEKAYWEGNLNRTINKMFVDMVAFSSFNHLEFSKYPELKEVWYGQDGQKIFCNLKHLVVRKCSFLANVLFSSNSLQLLYTLEELEVAECDSLEAIFDVKALDNGAIESKQVSGLKKLTISGLSNLKRIWNMEAGEIISFRSLQTVKVDKCPNIKYLFSVSLCHDMKQLEELWIESCGVDKVVHIEEELLEEVKFDFPQLTSLKLFNLRELTDFCPKRYTLECPSLKYLNVGGFEELKIFAFDHLNSEPLRKGDIELQSKQVLFYVEKVSQNLEELPLNEEDTMRMLNGNYERNLFQSVKKLHLQHFRETPMKFINDLIQKFPATTTLQARCSSFQVLFSLEEFEIPTQIKGLWLYQLEQLGHIWSDDGSASHPLSPNLEDLSIVECCRLISLAPPLTSFTNLTTLRVEDCNGLMSFMSPFTAKSLVHLTSLAVRNCGMLEEMVMTDEGGSQEEIVFKRLKVLELTCLSSFKSFCFGKHIFIFPSLVTFKVTGCHKMQSFSSGITIAPFMKIVQVENGRKRWKGDLNTTINHLFIERTNENLNMDTAEASSSKEQVEESNTNQIADFVKQKTQKLPNESYETQQNEKDLSFTQNAPSPFTTQVTGLAKGTPEMGEIIERSLVEAAKVALSPTGVYDAEVNDTIEKPLIQTAQQAQRTSAGEDLLEESHESRTCFKEDSFNHPKTFEARDKIETVGTHAIQGTMDKPLIQTDQDAKKLALMHNSEKFGTEKISNTIEKASIPVAQDVSNSTIPEADIDPSSSKVPDLLIPPMQKSSIYRNYKDMVDILEQNMPYLEAGVNRHPQVLNWLNTNQQRVLASSSLSLFAEVTRILRTTRRGHLLEDDRSYIRKCCAVLEVVGFDASWLRYVYKCIEECGDAEDIKRKVEETKGQLESIKKELTSVEDSLALLLNKASRLEDFIES